MRMRVITMAVTLGIAAAPLLMPNSAVSGPADVVKVDVSAEKGGTFRFSVTVRHDDTGWEHYADGWDIVAPDGTILATRELLHPHETEQPFTRSLGGVAVPGEITTVTVRAHDSVHGYGGETIAVDIPER